MDWKTEYATGIHHIDQQHVQIIEFITLFEKIAEDQARWHEARPLVLRTQAFMAFHFSAEESLMRALPYRLRDAHLAEHRRDLQHIAHIESGMLHGRIRNSLAPQMRHCLFRHIATADRHFARYALGHFAQSPLAAAGNGSGGSAMRGGQCAP